MKFDKKHNQPKEIFFDPDSLRAKYREERDKRLKTDGNEQYREVVGDFSHYIDDPYVKPGFRREALSDEVEVAIIGGGFGGILAGVRLRQEGMNDLRIIEKAGDFGGTWYWNRYPGAACDMESYIYLPLLEEMDFIPKNKFPQQSEILDYSKKIAEKYNLYENVCFQTEVESLKWNEKSGKWTIFTNRGDQIKARYVVSANGPLNRPKLPAISGITKYKGHSFHTSRWDYEYTGGNSEGNLTGLKDKKVAIIGTGATAVQCIPHLGEMAEHLYVFQRTPSSIDVRNDHPTDKKWYKNQEKGWYAKRRDNFNTLVSGGLAEEDLVNDGWTEIIRNLIHGLRENQDEEMTPEKFMNAMEMADFEKMEQVRQRVEKTVKDRGTAEALKPYYRQFCKRPCFHDEYLPTFNRSNVTLVNTDGKGVNQITDKGVVFDGIEYEVDCIIFGSGFEVGTAYTRRCGYEIYGENGVSISEKWKDGLATFHGLHSRGFPNCFFFGPQHSAFTANYVHSLDEQSIHLAYILKQSKERGVDKIEASEAAEKEWIETIIDKAQLNQGFLENCTPGYYNNEGQPRGQAQNASYGGGPIAFFGLMDKWRTEGNLEGLELSN